MDVISYCPPSAPPGTLAVPYSVLAMLTLAAIICGVAATAMVISRARQLREQEDAEVADLYERTHIATTERLRAAADTVRKTLWRSPALTRPPGGRHRIGADATDLPLMGPADDPQVDALRAIHRPAPPADVIAALQEVPHHQQGEDTHAHGWTTGPVTAC
jgi:hypothetical protein